MLLEQLQHFAVGMGCKEGGTVVKGQNINGGSAIHRPFKEYPVSPDVMLHSEQPLLFRLITLRYTATQSSNGLRNICRLLQCG